MDNYRRIKLMNKIATGLQKKSNDTLVNMFNANKNADDLKNMQDTATALANDLKEARAEVETLKTAIANSENLTEATRLQGEKALAEARDRYNALSAKLQATTNTLGSTKDALSKSQDAFKGLSTATGAGVAGAVGTGVGLGVNKLIGNTSLKSKIIAALLGATTFGSAGAYAGNKYSDQIADATYAVKKGVGSGVKATSDFVKSSYDSASDYINDLISKVKA